MSACLSCGAVIRWVETTGGGRTPLNPDDSPHWATCPQAVTWRGKTRDAVKQLGLFHPPAPDASSKGGGK